MKIVTVNQCLSFVRANMDSFNIEFRISLSIDTIVKTFSAFSISAISTSKNGQIRCGILFLLSINNGEEITNKMNRVHAYRVMCIGLSSIWMDCILTHMHLMRLHRFIETTLFIKLQQYYMKITSTYYHNIIQSTYVETSE